MKSTMPLFQSRVHCTMNSPPVTGALLGSGTDGENYPQVYADHARARVGRLLERREWDPYTLSLGGYTLSLDYIGWRKLRVSFTAVRQTSRLTDVATDLSSLLTYVATDLSSLLTYVATDLSSLLTYVATDLTSLLTDVSTNLTSLLTDVATNLTSLLTDVSTNHISLLTDVATDLISLLTDYLKQSITPCYQDGTKVFMASCDKMVKCWDLGSNQTVQVAQHDAPVKTCHWVKGPAYSCLMTGSWDKTLKFWDTRSPAPMMTINLPERVYCADVVTAQTA
uniref:Peroxin-7 n=1 Tax=Timema poppense TaxID=170557 RepID=A0A7R9DGC1_TIMPO|nr:unnamed protein product [Timema poppensis]